MTGRTWQGTDRLFGSLFSEDAMLAYLLKTLRYLLECAEHSRRDVYLASSVDLCELERRMRSMELDG
jgi:Protein of unknown function (DUF3563)